MDKTCCTLKKGKISADTGKTDACIAELSTESDCKKKLVMVTVCGGALLVDTFLRG